MVRHRSYARVARPIPHARRSRISASPSAPHVIRGGPAGRSWSIPQGGWNNSTGGMRGTTPTTKDDTARVVRASVEGQTHGGTAHTTEGVSIALEHYREVRLPALSERASGRMVREGSSRCHTPLTISSLKPAGRFRRSVSKRWQHAARTVTS